MDTAQWPQEIVVKPIEEIVTKGGGVERKPRPQKERALNCPRCHSTNTKFCYYNNYSLTQPRYFCKTCRRYWTEGGSLRNIPVGGGSRKNKRSSSSSSSKSLPPTLPQISTQNPNILQARDLKLTFPATPELFQVSRNVNDNSNNISASPSALELLNGINSSRGVNSFTPIPAVQDPNTVYTSGFPLPTLSFSLDGLGTAYPALQNVRDTFQDLKQVSSTSAIQQNKEQGNSTGYWTGMLGGGSW